MTCLKTSCRFRWAGIGVGVTAVGVVDRDILPLNRTDILEVPGLEETFEHIYQNVGQRTGQGVKFQW